MEGEKERVKKGQTHRDVVVTISEFRIRKRVSSSSDSDPSDMSNSSSWEERALASGCPCTQLLLFLQSVAGVIEEEEEPNGARRGTEPRRRGVNSVCYCRGPEITVNAVNMNDALWMSHADL